MNDIVKSAITLSLAATMLVLVPAGAVHAQTYSKSKDLVVVLPRDLPEPAQLPGNALLLHSNGGGSTYLYVEQEEGARLSVFDVTDPAHIRLAASVQIPSQGPFDFVRSLGENAELVYFRESQQTGVLDLRKAKTPRLRALALTANLGTADRLGESGFLATNASYNYVPAVARDFQIVGISSANLTSLASVKGVKHSVTNDETGTTFLLGSDGLTVLRQRSVEDEYKSLQVRMRGN